MGDEKYYGTQATFDLWQPKVETAEDFSLTQLWMFSGSYENNDLNTIEVGWQVRPQLKTLNTTSYKLCIMLHLCFQCISDAERARATVGSTPGCPYS